MVPAMTARDVMIAAAPRQVMIDPAATVAGARVEVRPVDLLREASGRSAQGGPPTAAAEPSR